MGCENIRMFDHHFFMLQVGHEIGYIVLIGYDWWMLTGKRSHISSAKVIVLGIWLDTWRIIPLDRK